MSEVGSGALAVQARVRSLHRFDEGLIKAMSRRVNYPNGAWPTEMRAETAAGYCDEPSVEAFLSKVRLGLYPKPCKQQGTLPKWHRTKLDETIALRHGLRPVGGLIAEDVVELI